MEGNSKCKKRQRMPCDGGRNMNHPGIQGDGVGKGTKKSLVDRFSNKLKGETSKRKETVFTGITTKTSLQAKLRLPFS